MANIIKNTSVGKSYSVLGGGGLSDVERDTFTCKHCNKVVFIEPGKDITGGGCRKCGGLICEKCVDIGTCTPFQKKLDDFERKVRKQESKHLLFRSIGIE